MENPEKEKAGCITLLTSVFRSRKRNSAKAPVESAGSTPTIGLPSLTRAELLSTASDPSPVHAIVGRKDSIERPNQELERGSSSHLVIPVEGFATGRSSTRSASHNQTKLDLWREAYNEVDDKTREWIGEIPSIIDVKATTDALVKLVRDREEKRQEETPKLTIGGHEIIWRDYANSVVTNLTTIGDIAIAFAPAPSSAVWSGVKVLLKANVTQCEDFTVILGCTDLVLSLARRGRVYEEVYIGDACSTDVQEDLKRTLKNAYKKCLEFLAFLDARLQQKRLKGFLDALVNPNQGKAEVLAIRELEKQLDMAIAPCQAQRSVEHDKLLRSLQLPLKRVDDRVAMVLKRLEEEELDRIKSTISTIPVGEQHGRIKERRMSGTGEWLVKDQETFLQWERSSRSSFLWLQGKLGTGKSFLSSKVIDRYLYDKNSTAEMASRDDEGFAFFYCNRGDSVSLDSILRSYIRQLSELPRRPQRIHQSMYRLYQDSKNIKSFIGREACQKALVAMINTYPRTILVLDGLDECIPTIRQELIDIFTCLMMEAKHVLKIFIASRVETDIVTAMKSVPQVVRMDTLDNAIDVEQFVEQSIMERKDWDISDSTKKAVKDKLIEKRDGMFRWTYLQWEKVKMAETDKGVQDILKDLPDTLREAYDGLYDDKNRGSFDLRVLQRAVRWVLSAREPLTSDILLPAIWKESQWKDEAPDIIGETDINERQLESICRHLITRDPQSGVWNFPHASVAEYFEDKSDAWIEDAPAELTEFLIWHLKEVCSDWPPPRLTNYDSIHDCWFDSEVAIADVSDIRHPFQRYVQQNWFEYVQKIPQESPKAIDVIHQLRWFLYEEGHEGPSSREYQAYCEYFWVLPSLHYGCDTRPRTDATFGIIAFGLYHLLPEWDDRKLEKSKENSDGQDLLVIAAQSGRHDLCKSLLSQGFDINLPVKYAGQSALGAAIQAFDIGTVEFLLNLGAESNRVMDDKSLLCHAAMYGSMFVQALLDYKADPNILCGDVCGWNALSIACDRGIPRMVEILAENGAHINPVTFTDPRGSPLAVAVHGGDIPTVQMLLKYDADVNAGFNGGEWGSILSMAIFEPVSTDMLRFLIEETEIDPGILMRNPPRDPEALRKRAKERIRDKAKYLIDGGHVSAQVLRDIGVPEEYCTY